MSLPSTIKAIGYRKTGDFDVIEEFNEHPFPQRKPDEVLIKVEYGGVNYIDTYERSGLYPTTLPKVTGQEASGTIVALPMPNDVEDPEFQLRELAQGDKVVAVYSGVFAEYVSVPWSRVFKLPSDMDTKTGAAIALQGLTALAFSLEAYEIRPQDYILIYGAAGGVGLFLTQIALDSGATVIATVSTEEKAQVVRGLLSKYKPSDDLQVIVTSQLTPEETLVDRVLEITENAGVQAVYDGIGKDTFEDNFKLAARKGTIVSFGNASGLAPPLTPLRLAEKNLKFVRPRVDNYLHTPQEQREYSEILFARLERGAIKPIIHGEYPFTAEGVRQAQKDLTSRGTIGKLLIKIA